MIDVAGVERAVATFAAGLTEPRKPAARKVLLDAIEAGTSLVMAERGRCLIATMTNTHYCDHRPSG